MEDLESQFGQTRPLLYTYEQAGQLFGDLEAMALEHKCTMTTVVDSGSHRPATIVGDEQESLLAEVVNTSVTVMGEYDNIVAFIGRLQGQQRKIWIRSLTIEPLGPDATSLQCKIDVSIYVIQEKEAVSHG